MIHQSVIDAWHELNEKFEGRVPSMYLDSHDPPLVTTGVGNLIDPTRLALELPWRKPDGTLASKAEIAAAWHTIKSRPKLAKLHWKYAANLTNLRLDDEDIDDLVLQRLHANARELAKTFPQWATFPADAQLGILSMAWAMGSDFTHKFPNFSRAVDARNWLTARANCRIRSIGNPGVIPRNRANLVCFANAAAVEASGEDCTILHWPSQVVP